MFPFSDRTDDGAGAPLDPGLVRRNVSDHGELPSAAAGDRSAPIYYVIGTGKLEVDDSHAVFFPTGGGQAARVAKGVRDDGAVLFSQAEIDAIVSRVQSLLATTSAGKVPSQLQLDALRAALNDPQQTFIVLRGNSPPAVQQVTDATVLPDGTVHIGLATGFIRIDTAGTVNDPTTLAANAFGNVRVRKAGIVLATLEAAGSALLAVYLLVIGILVLRQHPAGRRLHVIYALVKLPLVAIGAIGWAWLLSDVMSSFVNAGARTVTGFAPGTGLQSSVSVAIMTVIAATYPVGLLLVFGFSRSVKEYYGSTTSPQ
jgi:hypothetical protein